jgi:hypothetical protein
MKKHIVFEFNETSITESSDIDIDAVITLTDGRQIVLPKLRGAVVCAPPSSICLFCQGRGWFHNVYRKVTVCPTCEGTGKRS